MPTRSEEISKFRLRVEYARLCNRQLLVTYIQHADYLEYGLKLIIKEEFILKLLPDGDGGITVNSPICNRIRSLTRLNISDCTEINKDNYSSYDIIGQYNVTSKIRKCALPVDDSCDCDNFVVNHNHDEKDIPKGIEKRRNQLSISKPNSVEIVISPPNAELEKAHNIEREMLLMSKYYDSLSRSDSLPTKMFDKTGQRMSALSNHNHNHNHHNGVAKKEENETQISINPPQVNDNIASPDMTENGIADNSPHVETDSKIPETKPIEKDVNGFEKQHNNDDSRYDYQSQPSSQSTPQHESHDQQKNHHERTRHRSSSIKEKRKRMRSKVMKTSHSNDDDSNYDALDDTSGKETNFDSRDYSSDITVSPPSSFDMFSDRESVTRSPRGSIFSLSSFPNGYISEKDDDKIGLTATSALPTTNGNAVKESFNDDEKNVNISSQINNIDKTPNYLPLQYDNGDNNNNARDDYQGNHTNNSSTTTSPTSPISTTHGCNSNVESPSGNNLSDDPGNHSMNGILSHEFNLPLICIDEIGACLPSSTLDATINKRYSGLKDNIFHSESGKFYN